MSLDEVIDKCWSDHAADPSGVAVRIGEALALDRDDSGVVRLSMLTHHVFGEHLGSWAEGLQVLETLSRGAVSGDDARSTLDRCMASLHLCAGSADRRSGMTASDSCRVTIMAASSLCLHDSQRAAAYLEEAALAARTMENNDPAVRAVASHANNIAGALQESARSGDDDTRLMIRAAELARRTWERAGTWREVERAEYRLAVCLAAAKDGPRAAEHAHRCMQIVRSNGSEPLELFFAAEALALSSLLNGGRGFADALRIAQASFEEIAPEDQPWCRPALDALRARADGATAGERAAGAL